MWCEAGQKDCEVLDEIHKIKEESLLLLATESRQDQLQVTTEVNTTCDDVVDHLENFCSPDLNSCGLIRWAIRNIILQQIENKL